MSEHKTSQGQVHDPIVAKCEGCGNVMGTVCKAYLYPEAKWRLGSCSMATHLKKAMEAVAEAPDPFLRERKRKARRW